MAIKIGLIGASGRFGKVIASLEPVVPITRTTSRKNLDCDVLIDVSSKEALLENLSADLPIVIGTTGHTDFRPLEEAAKRIPLFYTPNFSLGIALMRKLAAEIALAFPSQIELIETHHEGKKDAPSGTALQLAQILPQPTIRSIRTGQVIGEHALHFNTPDESLILIHKTNAREAYARGALAAAHFLIHKPPGLYNMDNLLSESVSSNSYARRTD